MITYLIYTIKSAVARQLQYWISNLDLRPRPLISSVTLPPADQICLGILVSLSAGDLLTWDAHNDLAHDFQLISHQNWTVFHNVSALVMIKLEL